MLIGSGKTRHELSELSHDKVKTVADGIVSKSCRPKAPTNDAIF